LKEACDSLRALPRPESGRNGAWLVLLECIEDAGDRLSQGRPIPPFQDECERARGSFPDHGTEEAEIFGGELHPPLGIVVQGVLPGRDDDSIRFEMEECLAEHPGEDAMVVPDPPAGWEGAFREKPFPLPAPTSSIQPDQGNILAWWMEQKRTRSLS